MRIWILALFGGCVFAQPPQGDQTGSLLPSTDERFRHYLHRTYSWQRMTLLGADSAIDHLLLDRSEWESGPGGFGCRYSSGFGGRIVRNSIELGAGMLFREDARYQPSNRKGFLRRVRFASTSALLARDAAGIRRFAYSRLAATTGGILMTSVWHPQRDPVRNLAEGVTFGYLGQMQNNLLTEFSPDLIRFGHKVQRRILGR